jgi:predicted transglutaminase-like cysteine proteinase
MEKRALRLLAAASLAAALAPTAAQAEATPAVLTSASLAKSEAILGTRSALAELMAQQTGVTLPQAAPTTASLIQPASRVSPLRMNAVLTKIDTPPVAVRSGRPDVFGTVALSVGSTPLDGRWHRVENARVTGSYATWARSLRGFEATERADLVNRFVNNRVTFVDDSRQFGRADVWLTASETLRRGRGDCEDYAIAKMQLLREAGIAQRDMYLVIAKDLVRRSDHAILVVRAGQRMLMLDNGSDELLDSESVADYRPVLTFAAGKAWTHGYRRSVTPAVTFALAEPTETQRSRSASLLAFNTGFSR